MPDRLHGRADDRQAADEKDQDREELEHDQLAAPAGGGVVAGGAAGTGSGVEAGSGTNEWKPAGLVSVM